MVGDDFVGADTLRLQLNDCEVRIVTRHFVLLFFITGPIWGVFKVNTPQLGLLLQFARSFHGGNELIFNALS